VTRLPITGLGVALLVIGLGCLVVGFIDFVVSGQNLQPPSLFWLWFLGMALLAAGAVMVGWSRRKGASSRFDAAYARFGALKARMDLHVPAEEARDLLTAAQQLRSQADTTNATLVPIPVVEEARRVDEEYLTAEGLDRIQSDLSAVLAEVGPELRAEATTIDEAFTAAAGTELMSDDQVKLLERRVESFAIQVEQGEAIARSHLADLRTAVDSLRQHLGVATSS
jgi:hypothetical protein